MDRLIEKISSPNQDYHQLALQSQSQLTKPPGSLDLLVLEGSGAAVLIPVIRVACALHFQMAALSKHRCHRVK